MTVVGWIVIAGVCVWLFVVGAGWLLAITASVFSKLADYADACVKIFLDFLGRGHLVRIYAEPADLNDLEVKLKKEDIDRLMLENFDPVI